MTGKTGKRIRKGKNYEYRYASALGNTHQLWQSQAYKDCIHRYGFVSGMRNTDGWPLKTPHHLQYIYVGGYVLGHFFHKRWKVKRMLRGQPTERWMNW